MYALRRAALLGLIAVLIPACGTSRPVQTPPPALPTPLPNLPVCVAVGDQSLLRSVPDDAGGSISVWCDRRSGVLVIYAQRLDASGHALWQTDGVAVSTSAGGESFPQVVADGAGGAVVAWSDFRNSGTTAWDIYAQRIDKNGVSLWASDGSPVTAAPGMQKNFQMSSDGAGGAIVAWEDGPPGATTVRAQRLDSSGAPQWGAGGILVSHQSGPQVEVRVASDGSGGAIVAWAKGSPGSAGNIYAQRLAPAGTFPWGLTDLLVLAPPAAQWELLMIPDGSGGAILTWSEQGNTPTSSGVFAQRVSGGGAVQWAANGVSVSATGGQPQVIADGTGGAVLAWVDWRDSIFADIYAQKLDAGGSPLWTPGGVPVCQAAYFQLYPSLALLGSGSVCVVWNDFRSGVGYDLYGQKLSPAGVPVWTAAGVPVSKAPYGAPWGQSETQLIPNGAGGVVAVWTDYRAGTHAGDIYAQLIAGTGAMDPVLPDPWPGISWESENAPVAILGVPQINPLIVPDGAGGAIVAWMAMTSPGSNYHVLVQRIDAAGVPLWLPGGLTVAGAPGSQGLCGALPDGAGGVILAWTDAGSAKTDLLVQRLDATGAPLWTLPGVSVSDAGTNKGAAALTSDGAGGIIIAWGDDRNSATSATDLFAQRLDSSGVRKWGADGVAVCTASNYQQTPTIVSDGASGAIISWQDPRSGTFDIYCQRVNDTGTVQWASNGVVLCAAAGDQTMPVMTTDGAGGAIVAWYDTRNGGAGPTLFVQRVSAAGAPQWASDGLALCPLATQQGSVLIATDGAGGAYCAWRELRGADYDVFAQRLDGAGNPQWAANGVPIAASPGDQGYSDLLSLGTGGFFLTWIDASSGWTDLYIQRMDAAGAAQWAAGGVPVSKAAPGATRMASDGAGGVILTWVDGRTGIGSNQEIYSQRITAAGAP